jgi:hypothetical protein
MFFSGAMHMAKHIHEPITVSSQQELFDSQTLPRRFTWRGRSFEIAEVGGEWRELGRWWEGEGERRTIRAITTRGVTMDLCQDLRTGLWTLAEVQD